MRLAMVSVKFATDVLVSPLAVRSSRTESQWSRGVPRGHSLNITKWTAPVDRCRRLLEETSMNSWIQCRRSLILLTELELCLLVNIFGVNSFRPGVGKCRGLDLNLRDDGYYRLQG